MSIRGTASYDGINGSLPPIVSAAVAAARKASFDLSCRPGHGRLLSVLAASLPAGSVIGETGAGCGVGLAWLASGAGPGVRLVSVERDPDRARRAQAALAPAPAVRVRHGDWTELWVDGPFDLLVLDGGGQGKRSEEPLDPSTWLRSGGLVVMDDFTPTSHWPPLHDGLVDDVRVHWFHHPHLYATEVRTEPDAATILAVYLPDR
jgi:predicted O-methyltransferase YrrM